MSDLLKPVVDTFLTNTRVLPMALEDFSPADAVRRSGGDQGNSPIFLAAHLTTVRYNILAMAGQPEENPWWERFGATAVCTDGADYPSVAEVVDAWKAISDKLHAAFDGFDDAQAMQALSEDNRLPAVERTQRGAFGFMAWHETYHIGQIAMLRTAYGLPGLTTKMRR
ncbi:MAG: DinB family protein [Acidobacteriota bacterium]